MKTKVSYLLNNKTIKSNNLIKGLVYSALRDLPSNNYSFKDHKAIDNNTYLYNFNTNSIDYSSFKDLSINQTIVLNKNNKSYFIYKNSEIYSENNNIYFKLIVESQYNNNINISITFGKNKDSSKENNDIIQFWINSKLIYTLNLKDHKLKNIYCDDNFGKPVLNSDSSKIVFIAEKEHDFEKLLSFEEPNKDINKLKDENNKDVKFNYIQNFGESLYDKKKPVMVLLDISNILNNKVKLNVIEDCFINKILNDSKTDENKQQFKNLSYNNIYPAFPQFDSDNNILFMGYILNFKLGIKYCHKRESCIYLIKNIHLIDNINDEDNNPKKEIPEIIKLTKNYYCNLYPKYYNKNKFVYFSNDDGFPHMNGFQLNSIDYSCLDNIIDTCLIDKEKENNLELFNGIYGYSSDIQYFDFISNELFLFSTNFKNTEKVFLFDINENIIIDINLLAYQSCNLDRRIDNEGIVSCIYTKRSDNLFILNYSSPNCMPVLISFYVDNNKYQKTINHEKNNLKHFEISDNSINKKIKVLNDINKIKTFIDNYIILDENKISKSYLQLLNNNKLEICNNNNNSNSKSLNNELEESQLLWKNSSTFYNILFDTIQNIGCKQLNYNNVFGFLLYNKDYKINSENTKINNLSINYNKNKNNKPLIYLIHGGPNSNYPLIYSKFISILISLDFDVLVVNYPGSSGFGQDYLNKLNGNIGDLDVNCCGEFMKSFLKEETSKSKYDFNKIYCYGGSHGGFLCSWLSVHKEYTNLFKKALILNPVTDLYSLFTTSDIPDWAYELSNAKKLTDFSVSDEDIINMKKKSPVFYTSQCNNKVLLLIGSKDLRVSPDNNGIRFYHNLKRKNKQAFLKVYPNDEHALSSPETNLDVLISMINFLFDE